MSDSPISSQEHDEFMRRAIALGAKGGLEEKVGGKYSKLLSFRRELQRSCAAPPPTEEEQNSEEGMLDRFDSLRAPIMDDGFFFCLSHSFMCNNNANDIKTNIDLLLLVNFSFLLNKIVKRNDVDGPSTNHG